LVKRDFTAAAPDRVWVADITYVRCYEGWLYLAIRDRPVQPQDRRLVDARHAQAEIVSDALAMAAATATNHAACSPHEWGASGLSGRPPAPSIRVRAGPTSSTRT
jgi:transposase InsO family protein